MPEMPLKESDFIKDVQRAIEPTKEKWVIPGRGVVDIKVVPEDIEEIAREISRNYDVKFIGAGKDSIVIGYPRDESKLYKVPLSDSDMPPKRAKKIYYLHKLAATVFPETVPQIHAAFGINPSELPAKYHPGFIVTQIDKLREYSPWSGDTLQPIGDMAITLGIPMDFDGGNEITGTDGKSYYVDQIDILSKNREWHPEKLFQMMANNPKYSKRDIKIARMCVDRLLALGCITIPDQNNFSTQESQIS